MTHTRQTSAADPAVGDLECQLALALTPNLQLEHLQAAGAEADPTRLVGQTFSALVRLKLGEAAAKWLAAPVGQVMRRNLSLLGSLPARLVLYNSPHYPPLLTQIDTPPVALFVQGDVGVLLRAQLAVVGSRSPTHEGVRTAREFAQFLARSGLAITSGLAIGIDAAAHQGALAGGGRTIAVLGSGLDVLYPPENAALAQQIIAQGNGQGGALVSEFPLGTAPIRMNFPRRDRLISGLSLGTLVVEAARHSGSLITARLAAVQGREVFAIPGSIHSPLSRGCHELIRQGAKLVENATDILSELNIPYVKQDVTESAAPAEPPLRRVLGLDKDYEILLDALGFEPQSIDALVDRTGLPSPHLASMLLILELEGRVGVHAGGRYSALRACE